MLTPEHAHAAAQADPVGGGSPCADLSMHNECVNLMNTKYSSMFNRE